MNVRNELYSIQSEMRSIINELSSISNGLRYNFSGISSGVCANEIDAVISKYRTHLNTLYGARIKEKTE